MAAMNRRCNDYDEAPAYVDYLSRGCFLLTYFRGDIGSHVDGHFKRALMLSGQQEPREKMTEMTVFTGDRSFQTESTKAGQWKTKKRSFCRIC